VPGWLIILFDGRRWAWCSCRSARLSVLCLRSGVQRWAGQASPSGASAWLNSLCQACCQAFTRTACSRCASHTASRHSNPNVPDPPVMIPCGHRRRSQTRPRRARPPSTAGCGTGSSPVSNSPLGAPWQIRGGRSGLRAGRATRAEGWLSLDEAASALGVTPPNGVA
jgi:hypothetical protein